MEPNLYCFPLAARMTNRYFAAVGFAAARFAGTDRAVAEPEMVVAGYMVAGQAAEIGRLTDIPAEEAVNH